MVIVDCTSACVRLREAVVEAGAAATAAEEDDEAEVEALMADEGLQWKLHGNKTTANLFASDL